MQKHIHLYVNHYSLSLGEKARAAIQHMCDFMVKNKLIKPPNLALFFRTLASVRILDYGGMLFFIYEL